MPPRCSKRLRLSPPSQPTSQASRRRGRPANSTNRVTTTLSNNTTHHPQTAFLMHQDILNIVQQAVEEMNALRQTTAESNPLALGSNLATSETINRSNPGNAEDTATPAVRQAVNSQPSAQLPGTVLYY